MLTSHSPPDRVAVRRDHTTLFLSRHSPSSPLSFAALSDDTVLLPRSEAPTFLLRHHVDPAEVTLLPAARLTRVSVSSSSSTEDC